VLLLAPVAVPGDGMPVADRISSPRSLLAD